MPCPDLEQLDAYLSESLPDLQRHAIDQHLTGCASCQSLLLELREHVGMLDDVRSAWSGDAGEARACTDDTLPDLPGYEILRIIHEGGQGIVYLARQQSTHRTVAIKLLLHGRFATRRQCARFEREIDLAASLEHPNIVAVFDSGVTDDGRLYLVMRFVDGQSLDEYLAAHPLGIDETLALFTTIADAVRCAHQRGIIHRDLKPSNVLIDTDRQPHLLDFGLAKPARPMDSPSATAQTQAGEFLGTLAYAAPEQVGGEPDVDVRTDVYSLGVVLFEMLTARQPYPVRGRVDEIVHNITTVEPARASSYRRDIDTDLDTIIARMLSKDRARRYQSVHDLLRDLEHRRAGRPIEARRDSTWYVLSKTIKRNRAAVTALAAIFVVLIIATIVSLLFWRAAVTEQRATAEARDDLRIALEQSELETRKVTAMNEFLVNMLGSVHPARHGRDITVREVLDGAAETIAKAFADQPLVEAELRTTIGNTYGALALVEQAELHLLRAIDIRTKRLGEDHPDTLASVYSLASLYHHFNQLGDAESLAERTLHNQRRVLGPEHLDTLASMNLLGHLRLSQGRYEEAETLWTEAYRLRVERLGAEHLHTLETANNLGRLYTETGRHDDAEAVLAPALATARRALGEENLITMRGMTQLGDLYRRQGRYDDAETLLDGVLHLHRDVLGPEHPETFIAANSLGWLYVLEGRYDDAETLLAPVLESARAVIGEEHPGTLQIMNNLSIAYGFQSRPEEAEALTRHVLDVRRRTLGAEHPDTLASMNNLASLHFFAGRFDEADTLWRSMLEICRRTLGNDHPETLKACFNLGLACDELGRLDEAESLYRAARDGRRRTLGELHPQTIGAIAELVKLLRRLDRHDEAIDEMKRIYQTVVDQPEPRPDLAHSAAEMLAELCVEAERVDEAARWNELARHYADES